MANSNFDDEFGGFEEAPALDLTPGVFNNQNDFVKKNSGTKSDLTSSINPQQLINTPEWLLPQQISKVSTNRPSSKPESPDSSLRSSLNKFSPNKSDSNSDLIKILQEDLANTKLLLIDQKNKNSYLQDKHRSELDSKKNEYSSSFANMNKEFLVVLKQSLADQKESFIKEFHILLDQNLREQEIKFMQMLKENQAKFEVEINYKLEEKLANFQEKIIKQNESFYEDLDIKVRQMVNASFNEEKQFDKNKMKLNFENIEKELKNETEKYVQNYFKNQSEIFKDQIKSGVQQEHLIHKDLINAKLEKLLKSSEEKRRNMNILFARNLSGLSFFIENAQKQMAILNQSYMDFLKNKEFVEFYGNNTQNNSIDTNELKDELKEATSLLASFLPFGQSNNKKNNVNNLFKENSKTDEEPIIDEELLADL